jgi:hypothetical protein
MMCLNPPKPRGALKVADSAMYGKDICWQISDTHSPSLNARSPQKKPIETRVFERVAPRRAGTEAKKAPCQGWIFPLVGDSSVDFPLFTVL